MVMILPIIRRCGSGGAENAGVENAGAIGCAQHCCNDDQQSQWENGDFDLCRSETPEFFIQKLDILITSLGATCMPNFMGIGPGVHNPQIAEI